MTAIDTIVRDAVFDIVLQGVSSSSSDGVNIFISRIWPSISVNESEYENAWSPENLNGSQFATENFSELVNNIPNFSQYYVNSGRKIEEKYGEVVNLARVDIRGETDTDRQSEVVDRVARIFSEAKRLFNTTSLASLRDPAIKYHASYPIPNNWAEQNASGNWTHIVKSIQIENSSVNLSLKYLLVNVIRPWLMTSLFDLPNWILPVEPGTLSNGGTDNNPGSFALLPSLMIVARDIIAVDALGQSLYQDLGLQVIAFVNNVMPFSPPLKYKWIGTTEAELMNSLSELDGVSIVIEIENYTNINLQKIYEDKKYGIYQLAPLSEVPANSAQGFTISQELTSGPEGWLVYSFNDKFNVMLYWKNFWTETNKGLISFIPRSMELTRRNLERYIHQENIVRVQDNFTCDAKISSGFIKANFNYTIMPALIVT